MLCIVDERNRSGYATHMTRQAPPPMPIPAVPRLMSMCGVVCMAGIVTFVGACAAPPQVLLESITPTGDEDGAYGQRGTHGASVVTTTVRVRGDAVTDVDVVYPTDSNGERAPGAWSTAVMVQGGAVKVEDYHWWAAHMASRGVVVVMPHFLLDLAFFEQGDALDALRSVRDQAVRGDGPVAHALSNQASLAVGHSLGGVVAQKAWLDGGDDVSHLLLAASVPDSGSDLSQLQARTTGAVLSLAGELDGLIGPDQVQEGARDFAAPTTAAQVEGLTHFQWTDVPADQVQEREPDPSPLTTEEARARALWLADAFVSSWLGDDAGTRTVADPGAWPPYLRALDVVGGER
jgi:pimeloyl-ACP methyl ester carboxylesterase